MYFKVLHEVFILFALCSLITICLLPTCVSCYFWLVDEKRVVLRRWKLVGSASVSSICIAPRMYNYCQQQLCS